MSAGATPKTVRAVTPALTASVIVGFTVCLFGSSLKNTVQVLLVPMAESFGQSRGSFAIATTAFAVTYAVAAPLTGMLADRFGPERVLLSGTMTAGLAFVLCGMVPAFGVFVAVYGVLASFAYAMVSYVPMGVLVDRLFANGRKGFFYALLTNGTAAGFILLVPLWGWLRPRTGWNAVLIGLGVFALVVLAPLIAWRFRGTAGAKPVTRTENVRPLVRSVLSTSVFWRLAGAFCACGASMAFIDVHMIPYLGDMQVPTDLSSASVGLLGIAEIGGSLVAGRLCDRGLLKSTLVGGYLLRAGSMFLVAAAPHGPFVLLFGAVFGASYLVTVVATSMWVLAAFPVEIKGAVMGLMWTVHQVGAALSSQLGAVSHDSDGSYVPAILATGGFALVATLLIASLPSPRRASSVSSS